MFPVLVSLSNEDGLLLPGMNGEVTILVARRDDVLAVPVDALRGMRDLALMAVALGLDADSVTARVQAQMAASASRPAGGDSARAGAVQRAGGRAAGARTTTARGGTGARSGDFQRGGSGGAARAAGNGAGARGASAQIAFVQARTGTEVRAVRTGVSDFEYTEVMSGLKEGDQVVLLGVVEIQAQRSQMTDRIRSRMGTGLTTSSGGSGGSGGGGSRGGQGGGR
jgi:HlyD family secretion protein